MDSKTPGRPKPSLNNRNTRFARFTWGEDERLRRAIQDVRNKMGELPVRFKVKL